MIRKPPLGRFLIRERGATAVEFALVLSALLAIIMGVFEFGRALHARNALDYVADRAARALVVDYRGTDLGLVDLQLALTMAARDDAPGLRPDDLTLALIADGTSTRIEVSYEFDFLIPLIPVAPVVLTARRLVPGA